MFVLKQVGLRYQDVPVLSDISLEFVGGSLTTIVGPNGAGKSTLLRIMMGLRPEHSGDVFLEGRKVHEWSRSSFGRKVAFLPQNLQMEFPFTCEQVVLMGRTPHADKMFETETDLQATKEAMAATDTLHLRSRDFRFLSGGERQRVLLASALAQKPDALLLDEPTTFLDLKHQIAIYDLIRELARQGLLVIAVTHDLALASAYSDRVLILSNGKIAADGYPAQALSPENIEQIFEVSPETMLRIYGH